MAKYMVMTGSVISAETALKIGLITAIVAKEELMNEAKKLARTLSTKSPVAMKAAKRSLNFGMNVDLPSGLSFELKTFAGLFASEDQKEGMKAFLEKRKAVYKGR